MNTPIINSLNDLLQKNLDAEHGYTNAYIEVDDPELKRFFKTRKEQRAQFARELNDLVTSMGGTPITTTSFASDAHRTWMDLRSAFTSDSSHAVLKECIRGEKANVNDYKESLDTVDFNDSTRNLLLRQYERVQASYEELQKLARVPA